MSSPANFAVNTSASDHTCLIPTVFVSPPQALGQLESIFQYISQDSPQNAAKMIRTLLDAIDRLDIMPYRYDVPRGRTTHARQIRSMPVKPYLVRYRIDDNNALIYVLAICHAAQR